MIPPLPPSLASTMRSESQFNPCDLEQQGERIPAKIWELLRRNSRFREDVGRLCNLDKKERQTQESVEEPGGQESKGAYHSLPSDKSVRLVERVVRCQAFAGTALQWLVPDPLVCI